MKEIDLPDGSIAEFPDGMPDAAIAAVLQKHFGKPEPMRVEINGVAKQPSLVDKFLSAARLEPFTEGLVMGGVRGAKDVVDTGAHGLSWAAEKIAPQTFAGETARVANENAEGKAAFKRDYGDSIGADFGRVIGQIAATGPLVKGVGMAIGAVPHLANLGQAVTTFGSAGGGIGTRMAGGAISGGIASGAVDPELAGYGAALGGTIPVVSSVARGTGRAVGNMVRPFTEKGRSDIANRIIREAAADQAGVTARLANPPRSVTPLTFTEVANDPGISSLQRTVVNASKNFSDDLAMREAAQNTARFNSLYGMSGGDAGIAAAKAARSTATQPMLDAALSNASDVGTRGIRAAAKDIGASPSFQRKAVKSAVGEAVAPFATHDASGARAWATKVPFDKAWGARQNIDDLLNGASNKVNEKAAQAASRQLMTLRERISTALEKASPDFRAYSRAYASESKKVDAATTLYDLVKAASTGSRDISGNPVLSGAMLDRTLKNIEPRQWAQLSAAQRDHVGVLVNELTQSARVKTLGKAVGSNTAQNLARPAEMPFALRMLSGLSPGGSGGMVTGLLDRAMHGTQEKIQSKVGQALLDPAVAAQAFVAPPAITSLYRQIVGQMPGQIPGRFLPVGAAGLLEAQP